MDNIVAEQVEWLISGNTSTVKHKKLIILLFGYFSETVPDDFSEDLKTLSKHIILLECFDAIMTTVRIVSQKGDETQNQEYYKEIFQQLAFVQKSLIELPQVNEANLISWIIRKAIDRKIVKSKAIQRPI